MKDPLVRFSVAIGGELLRRFDRYRELHRYPNRSEAVRGLMRGALIEETIAQDDSEAMGVVTLIYDHHVSPDRAAADRLAAPSSRPRRHHDSRSSRRKAMPGSDLAPRPSPGDPQPRRRLDRHQGGRDRPARARLGRGRRRAKRRRAIRIITIILTIMPIRVRVIDTRTAQSVQRNLSCRQPRCLFVAHAERGDIDAYLENAGGDTLGRDRRAKTP